MKKSESALPHDFPFNLKSVGQSKTIFYQMKPLNNNKYYSFRKKQSHEFHLNRDISSDFLFPNNILKNNLHHSKMSNPAFIHIFKRHNENRILHINENKIPINRRQLKLSLVTLKHNFNKNFKMTENSFDSKNSIINRSISKIRKSIDKLNKI